MAEGERRGEREEEVQNPALSDPPWSPCCKASCLSFSDTRMRLFPSRDRAPFGR